jgi:uncharacterized protein
MHLDGNTPLTEADAASASGAKYVLLSCLSNPKHISILQPLFLILPGWQNSGTGHWQSRWEQLHGYTRVQQHDWQRPLRGDWIARLEEEVLSFGTSENSLLLKQELEMSKRKGLLVNLAGKIGRKYVAATHQPNATVGNILLVAHSLGCHQIAAWAAHSQHTHRVRGALLVAPPDVTRDDLPPDLYNWRKPVLNKLPFPATCVISTNDPFSSLAAGRAMAAAWGARSIELGAFGHINGDSGLGVWPAGHAWLTELRGQ